jgi:hypothetical protein
MVAARGWWQGEMGVTGNCSFFKVLVVQWHDTVTRLMVLNHTL